MKKIIFLALSLCVVLSSCDRKYDSPDKEGKVNAGVGDPEPKFYIQQYDKLKDEGQFWHPDAMSKRVGYSSYNYGVNFGGATSNSAYITTPIATNSLQHSMLSMSYAAMINRGLADGRLKTGAWVETSGIKAHSEARQYSKMATTWGIEAFQPMYHNVPGYAALDNDWYGMMGRKYVLTDVKNNPESGLVGVVAAHVHEALIIDVRDETAILSKCTEGYALTKVYDATTKSTTDAWAEFKDKCNNRALVVMPVHTSELVDFAIANNLFVINLNKQKGTSAGGQNTAVFKEVLAWLQPNSPVYGWEPGVGEDEFVNLVSKSGNMMVATSDPNLHVMSENYKNRQKQVLAKIIDPHTIDYTIDKKFVSFYLSDGPHAGWMIGNFIDLYYKDPKVSEVNMSFGVTPSNVCQMAPLQMEKLFNEQNPKSTLIESFGGGYYYSDDFGTAGNRSELLKGLATKMASHMRQHRVKVLEQIAHDPRSPQSKEAYQAFVDANDQLEGIVAIQYAPSYAQCDGDIMWVTNKAGYDIPIVTVRYTIWDMGQNTQRDGTPTFVAHKLNAQPQEAKFSAVIIHAWSAFEDTGESDDEVAENAGEGTYRGASAAAMCTRRLNDDTKVVNMQELIWRIRMQYRPDQTKKFLNEYY